MNSRCLLRIALPLILVWPMAGCGSRVDIREYSVPKAPARDQIMAAMIPAADKTWFFKMAGPAERLAALEADFKALVASVDLETGEPTWTLPDGWAQQAGSGIRHATLVAGSPPDAVELTVIPLATGGDPWDEYLLANVNRWRGELGQRPLLPEELADHTSRIALERGDATLMVARGDLSAPTTSGLTALGPSGGMADLPEGGAADTGEPVPPRFELPEGWRVAPGDQFSLLAFEAGPKLDPLRITLTPARGGVFANINRWRTQMSLPPLTPEEMGSALVAVDVGGHSGQLIALDSPPSGGRQQSMLGVAVEIGGTEWYVKLRGEQPQVESERERFEQFLSTLTFEGD